MPEQDPDNDLAIFLDAVRKVAGEDGIRAIIAAKGGLRITVPGKITSPSHWIAEALGLEHAEAVIREIRTLDEDGNFCGMPKFTLPLGERGALHRFRSALNLEAARQLREGISIPKVSAELGLSPRSLFRMRKQLGLSEATDV